MPSYINPNVCRRCGVEKDPSEFYTDRSHRTGKMRTCKACIRAQHAVWMADPENIRRRNEQQSQAHRADPRPRMLRTAENRARRKGLEFSITIADIVIPKKCPIFGVDLVVGDKLYAPSLDRIENSRGYVPGNVMVISRRANVIKNDASTEELRMVLEFYERLAAARRAPLVEVA